MKIRELLQIDLRSKRTTRNFLVGFGFVCAIAAVGFVVLCVVELYWLTPGECLAAREALVQVDALQNLDSTNNQDFVAKSKLAEGKVKIAVQAALTVRDEKISSALDAYLIMTVSNRYDVQDPWLMQQRHVPTKN
jgi:hypothetical protein